MAIQLAKATGCTVIGKVLTLEEIAFGHEIKEQNHANGKIEIRLEA